MHYRNQGRKEFQGLFSQEKERRELTYYSLTQQFFIEQLGTVPKLNETKSPTPWSLHSWEAYTVMVCGFLYFGLVLFLICTITLRESSISVLYLGKWWLREIKEPRFWLGSARFQSLCSGQDSKLCPGCNHRCHLSALDTTGMLMIPKSVSILGFPLGSDPLINRLPLHFLYISSRMPHRYIKHSMSEVEFTAVSPSNPFFNFNYLT